MGKTKSFKITPKHRRFVRYYIQTGNASESGRLAGFTAQYGRMMMSESTILDAINEAQQKAGLTDEFLERKHIELMNCGERNVELGATRLGYQVKKKIGGDELPPGIPPAVIIIRQGNGTNAKGRGVPVDGTPGLSIRRADKP